MKAIERIIYLPTYLVFNFGSVRFGLFVCLSLWILLNDVVSTTHSLKPFRIPWEKPHFNTSHFCPISWAQTYQKVEKGKNDSEYLEKYNFITLFRSIIVFRGTSNIYGIFPHIFHIQTECGKCHEIFCGILSVPKNIVMNLNNVMSMGMQHHYKEYNTKSTS